MAIEISSTVFKINGVGLLQYIGTPRAGVDIDGGRVNVMIDIQTKENFNEILAEALAKQNRKTNADRVRSMDDEDLAIFLENVSCKHSDTRSWLHWLQAEVTDNG